MKIIPIIPWSATKLKTFNTCKFHAQLQYGQKIPEPERPLPPGKTEHANDRGSRIHLAAENYVQGKGPMIPELNKFVAELDSLKQLFSEGKVSIEGEWAFDRDWAPVPWSGQWVQVDYDHEGQIVAKKLPKYGKPGDVYKIGKQIWEWESPWLRAKLDAIVFLSPTEAVVVDYKTGRKFGNEVGHMQQMQIYQLAAFLKYPQLEFITVELWYLDQPDEAITQATFTRTQGLRFRHSIDRQAFALTDCVDFPANPNIFNCRWCYYSNRPGGTGHCAVGVW